MAVTLPTSAPPVEAADRIVPFLLAQLPATPSIESLPVLGPLVHLLAQLALSSKSSSPPTLPLEHLLSLASSNPARITIELLIDTLIAYAPYRSAITQFLAPLLATHTDGLKECLTELTAHLSADDGSDLSHTARAVRTLLCLSRAHDEVLAMCLEEAATLLPSLSAAYGRLPQSFEGAVVRVKNDALGVVRGLLSRVEGGTRDVLMDLLGPPDKEVGEAGEGRVLRSNGLRGDYEALFVRREMKEGVRKMLEGIREEVPEDPRLAAVTSLFPALPKQLVVQALNHPLFAASSSTQSPDEAAAPLVNAILMGGTDLPPELDQLRAAIASSSLSTGGADGSIVQSTVPRPKSDRRNIFDTADLDISKLKIKAEEAPLPSIGRAIPDHLRESILRLVQDQEDEEEERKRAIAEYEGRPVEGDEMDMDDFSPLVRVGSGGDTSDQDDSSGSHKITRKPRNAPETFYNQHQLMALEMAYLTTPAVYDRNAATRRGEARAKLRKETGLDDTQLEGWRIIFDRNPHGDAILARYSTVPNGSHPSLLAPATGDAASSASSRGRGRGGSRGGGGRGKGSHGGSTVGHSGDVSDRGGGASGQEGPSAGGSRGGRGGGGGRGRGTGEGGPRREHKGSRGHQNAARTRGHDRKMGRMGAGLGE